MIKLSRPLVFLDIESTGIKPDTDRIVELAMCKVFPDGRREVKTTLINPLVPIPPLATEIHGIKDEDVLDKPTFKQLSKSILEFLQGSDLAGFNSIMFDFPILFYEFERANCIWDYSKHEFVDVGNLYKIFEPRTLTAAYRFYCDADLLDAHSAEADILATVEVFTAQVKKYGADMPTEVHEIAAKSNYDRKIVDIGGKFGIDADGDYIFNFGKYKGEKLKHNIPYCEWILNADFPSDVKRICSSFVYGNFDEDYDNE